MIKDNKFVSEGCHAYGHRPEISPTLTTIKPYVFTEVACRTRRAFRSIVVLVKTYKRWYATTEDFGVLIIDADHRFQVKGVYFDFWLAVYASV